MLVGCRSARLLLTLPFFGRSLLHWPFTSRVMATVETSPARAILDRLIDHVSKLNVSASPAPSSSSPATASSPSVPSSSSYLPAHTVDVAWRPIIPLGHTAYTWVGDEDTPPTTSSATTSSPQPTASSSPSNPPPAATAAPPIEKPRAPTKEKKAGGGAKAAPVKAEEVKSDQPDISRLDIRVGQVVKAWKHSEGQSPANSGWGSGAGGEVGAACDG
jgi:hypothetical protein